MRSQGTVAPRSALVEVLAVTVSALWIQVLPEAPLSGLPHSRAALPELAPLHASGHLSSFSWPNGGAGSSSFLLSL